MSDAHINIGTQDLQRQPAVLTTWLFDLQLGTEQSVKLAISWSLMRLEFFVKRGQKEV
jgi:hypothetical protein